MAELLEIYDLNGKFMKVEERNKFYSKIKDEFAKKGKISRQVKSIRLILMNSSGRIYLQKRSRLKNENPGLYDKTIGGHVPKGFTWDMTVIKECSEELGFPVAVLSPKEFNKVVKSVDLGIIGIFKKIDYVPNFESVRISQHGKKFIQPFITTIYIGYYDGSIRFADGESSGVEALSLEELKREIKNNPNRFTEDLKFMVKKYGKFLRPIK